MKNQIDLLVYPRNKKMNLESYTQWKKLQILRNSEMHVSYIEVLKTSWGLMPSLNALPTYFCKFLLEKGKLSYGFLHPWFDNYFRAQNIKTFAVIQKSWLSQFFDCSFQIVKFENTI